ncbi:hypothetical protein [Microbacterium esteraromaticum]|uniref:hypothetical protein n=1 Tax=Microbacterium esteraromaticum TaxID=57043 RepID=UPI001957D987|nr:hypothetical protein [Microbacterium esteraromaticum]MBM7465306.1 hypothetical protein [Microbacterium esteraromaticum]
MTDVVIVALIGVAGTLAGGVFGPLAKDRLDRRAKRRDETHQEIGEILAKVDALLMKMLRLNRDASEREWWDTREKAVAQTSRLGYLLGKGEGEIAGALEIALMHAHADGTKATSTANHSLVSATTAQVAAWYRGERSPKGIQQQVVDFWQTMYDGVVSGAVRPGGEEVDPSELDEAELQRRAEIEKLGGAAVVARRQRRRRFWRFRR